MVRKGKQRSTFYVVSFKLSEQDYRKIEQIKKICRDKGLKFNKTFVLAMTQYFNMKDCPQEEQKVEPKKEQILEKSTSTFEQNLASPKKEIEKLPSFFEGNPWISILMNRK